MTAEQRTLRLEIVQVSKELLGDTHEKMNTDMMHFIGPDNKDRGCEESVTTVTNL